MKRFYQIIDKPGIFRTSVALVALFPLALGAAWLCAFLFTGYRPDIKSLGIAFSIATFIFGLYLFAMFRWAILLSSALSLLLALGCLTFIFTRSWVYIFPAALCLLYPVIVKRHFHLHSLQTKASPPTVG